MYSRLAVIFLLVAYATSFSSKLSLPHMEGRVKKPPPQPTRPPGNCTPPEFEVLKTCYVNYLGLYGLYDGNGPLPHKTTKPFDKMLDELSSICKNYQTFMSCENNVAPHCISFKSLQILAGDESDALYYLQNMALIELYCDHRKQYIIYSQCLERIDMNELQELVYEECELNIHDNCTAVQKTVKCERGVVTMVCDSKESLDAYCTYQNLQMRRAGWNYCNDMPCSSSSITFTILLLLAFLELFK